MTLKEKIHHHFLGLINDKINQVQQVLADLKETGANETKSTAGDKHETALAMIQIEQANNRAHLNELLEQKAALEKVNPALSAGKIVNGSLVKTDRGWLYISIALGKAIVEAVPIISLSAKSPLGIKLLGLTVGDTAEINNNKYLIEEIA